MSDDRPMNATHGGVWTTRDELHFLSKIGRWRRLTSPPDREALLVGYREGLGRRRVWAGLDRLTVLAAVEEELDHERRKEATRDPYRP